MTRLSVVVAISIAGCVAATPAPSLDAMFQAADADGRAAHASGDPAALDRALDAYARLAAEPGFAGYARLDEVLFWNAQLEIARGRPREATALLTRMIAARPSSELIADAQTALADLAFDRDDIATALIAYGAAARRGGKLASYARYRIAWCHLRLGDPRTAIDELVALVTTDSPKLATAARRDVVLAYMQLSPAVPDSFDDARATLRAAAGGDLAIATTLGEALAHAYCDAGAARCLEAYRELAPRDECPTLERAATELVAAARESAAVCRGRIIDALGTTAMQLHRDGTAAALASAETLYATYLDGGGDSATVAYFAGELAYARGDNCAAAPRYARAVRSIGAPDPDEAAYAHVLATLQCEGLRDVAPPVSDAVVPQPIPPAWQRVLEATELYLKIAKSPDPAVHYEHARILYAFAHLRDAIDELRAVSADASADLAVVAATLLADADQRTHDPHLVDDVRRACQLGADLGAACR